MTPYAGQSAAAYAGPCEPIMHHRLPVASSSSQHASVRSLGGHGLTLVALKV